MTSGDYASASERLTVAASTPLREHATVQTSLTVRRWDAEQTEWTLRKADRDSLTCLRRGANVTVRPETFARYGVRPYLETRDDNCNAIVQTGWVALLGGVGGTSISAKFSATNGRIGVGTSSTAVAWGQTYLVGDTGSSSTTSYYALCGSAPTITTSSGPATMAFTASFGTGVANFAWNEFGTDNATASGVYLNGLAGSFILLNRGVSSQGTKASGQTWSATETLQFGYPDSAGVVGAVS